MTIEAPLPKRIRAQQKARMMAAKQVHVAAWTLRGYGVPEEFASQVEAYANEISSGKRPWVGIEGRQ